MKEETKNKIRSCFEKNEKLIFGIIIAIFAFAFYISYSIHNIPYTAGWGNSYADMMMEGKMVYRDFYYYLPPINLLIDILLWKFSFGHLFIYTLFRIIERVIIVLCMYGLISKFAKPRYAAIGTMIGAVIFSAQYYDLIGDYNQTTLLLTVLLTSIYIRYIQRANTIEDTDRKQILYLLYGGIILGLSFLLKQTLFLAEVAVFFIALTVFFIVKKKKGYIKSIGLTLAGLLIPIVIIGIWLAINNALVPFIQQVYLNVDSKGSVLSILTSYFKVCFSIPNISLVAFSIVCIFLYKGKLVEKDRRRTVYTIIYVLPIMLMAGFIVILNNDFKMDGMTISYLGCIIFEGLGTILFSKVFSNTECKSKKGIFFYLFLAIIIFALVVIKYLNNKTDLTILLIKYCFNNFIYLFQIANIVGLLSIIYFGYKFYKTKDTDILIWFMLLAGGIAYSYNRAMAASLDITNVGSTFLVPILITYTLYKTNKQKNIIRYVVLILCLLIPISCISNKSIYTYLWWGWNEATYEEQKWNKIDIPGLEGFRVTKDTKKMYEEMYKVIKENTNSDSIIYGFPNTRIFNVLLQNENMNYFVPVPFYDVVADTYMKEDIETLKNSPPDIIVWIDMANAYEVNEDNYRDGKPLVQREFQEWLMNEAQNGRYTLIGKYNDIRIYKLNDGTEPKYTFFYERSYHVNWTDF